MNIYCYYYYLRQIGYVFVFLCLLASDITQKVAGEFSMNFFGGVECVTGIRWLDFGGYPGHDADPAIIYMNFITSAAQ